MEDILLNSQRMVLPQINTRLNSHLTVLLQTNTLHSNTEHLVLTQDMELLLRNNTLQHNRHMVRLHSSILLNKATRHSSNHTARHLHNQHTALHVPSSTLLSKAAIHHNPTVRRPHKIIPLPHHL